MNYPEFYANFLKKFLKVKKPLKVVFDCSNGTTGLVLKKLFSNYHLLITSYLNAKPDGRFPAHGPDPLAPGALVDLRLAIRKHRADLGMIFDADGDRVLFLDDLGRLVPSDAAAMLISKNYAGPAVLDVRAGYALKDWFRGERRRVITSRVGHFFIKKLMRKHRAAFGAEQSGHYYFKDFFYCDSGIFAAILMINQLSKIKDQGLTMSNWIRGLPKYYRIPETNFRVKDKEAAMKRISELYQDKARRIFHLDGLRMEFGPAKGHALHSDLSAEASAKAEAPQSGAEEWWFNVRPSNTENLLRLNLEARTRGVLKAKARELKKIFKRLGALEA